MNAPPEATRDQYGFLPDPFITYRVKMDGYSFMAGFEYLRGSARDLKVVFSHMHRKITVEHWVLIGDYGKMEHLGLPSIMREPQPLNVPSHPRPGQPSPDDIKQSILNAVEDLRRQGVAVFLCIDDGPQVEHIHASAEQSSWGVVDGEYDRYSSPLCDTASIELPRKNTTPMLVTQVAFHRPALGFDKKSWFPMHTGIFVNGIPGDDVSVGRPMWLTIAAELSYDDVSMYAMKGLIFLIFVSTVTVAVCILACRHWCKRKTDGVYRKVQQESAASVESSAFPDEPPNPVVIGIKGSSASKGDLILRAKPSPGGLTATE